MMTSSQAIWVAAMTSLSYEAFFQAVNDETYQKRIFQ